MTLSGINDPTSVSAVYFKEINWNKVYSIRLTRLDYTIVTHIG